MTMPKSVRKGERMLRLCARCRQSKIRCDAILTRPRPCTCCAKRSVTCVLDVSAPVKREYDAVERLVTDVHDLHRRLERIVAKKTRLVDLLLARRLHRPRTPATPPVAQIQAVLHSPDEKLPEEICLDPIPTLDVADRFTISSDQRSPPCTVSYARARALFDGFNLHFRSYLPVLPESFFRKDLLAVHRDSDVLFWVIVTTALLREENPQEYLLLVPHVRNLVVVNCWFRTPRSVYSLVALLVLTTWPLPNGEALRIQDNISVKYTSLMKSLALQYGLHKPSFLNEFSQKTSMSMDAPEDENIRIRERIYKYVNINSNYWLVFLGLSNPNYNGFQLDYVTAKAANVDLLHKDDFSPQDNFINSLLKISLVQLKMNENMGDFIHTPNHVSKLIHLHMFETILDSYKSPDSPILHDGLLLLSVEYSKLHLYIYSLSDVALSLPEYKSVIRKTIVCCKSILSLFEANFSHITNFHQVPIHFRFGIELAALFLLNVHSTPLLNSIDQYVEVKHEFARAYKILTKNANADWRLAHGKLFKIIDKYDACDKVTLLKLKNHHKSFFLVNKMTNYLVSSLHYEMIWDIYQMDKIDESHVTGEPNWAAYGLEMSNHSHQKIVDYITTSGSVIPREN